MKYPKLGADSEMSGKPGYEVRLAPHPTLGYSELRKPKKCKHYKEVIKRVLSAVRQADLRSWFGSINVQAVWS